MSDADPVVADFAAHHPESFARVLGHGTNDQVSGLVPTLPPESVASIVARLPASRLLALLESGEQSPQRWLQDAPFDDAVMLLSRMRRERRIALIDSVEDPARKRELLRHEQYPANTAGALLQDMFLRIDASKSLAAVVEDLRDPDREDLPLLVVVDSATRYVGILKPWQLISSRIPKRSLAELADPVPPISPETPVSGAAAHTGWLEHNLLPVVDSEQRVLGALSRKAVMHAAGQDTSNGAGPANFMMDLLGGLTNVLSDLLEGILARRTT